MRPRGKHTTRQGDVITRIDLYIKAYEEAKKNGDMRTAEDNALRALSTARDLQSGK
jgi:hypothetical protein